MKYNLELEPFEKQMIEMAIRTAEIELGKNEDYYSKTSLANYKKLLKKVQELKSIG